VRTLDRIVGLLDALTAWIGRAFSWLTLFMVLMTFANVVLRYVFGLSIVAAYETVVYAFGIVLTGVAGWTLLTDQHVRIDVFYGRMSGRAQAWVNVVGTVIFLVPLLYVVASRSWGYVGRSWKMRETSNEIAGLDYLYVLKSFMLVFVVVLAIQGLAFFLRNLRVLILGGEIRGPAPGNLPAPPPGEDMAGAAQPERGRP